MAFLESLMFLLAAGSLLGVLGATLIERIIPILPSYLLLLSIGITTARNEESLVLVAAASLLGSIAGCWVYFSAASLIGSARTNRWGQGLARLSGISQRRMRRMSVGFRRGAPWLSFLSQLVPGLRLVAPGIAGAVGIRPTIFFPFALLGISVWNLFFIGAGYLATMRNPEIESGAIALVVLIVFLGVEAAIAALWCLWQRWTKRQGYPVPRAVMTEPSAGQAVGK